MTAAGDLQRESTRTDIFAVVIVALISLIPLRSFLWFGDWMTHDLQGYEVRLAALVQSIARGDYLGRWCSDLEMGYGYPLFHYYAPGYYLIAAKLYLIGFSIMSSIKLSLCIFQILGTAGMFGLARLFYNWPASIITALLYALLPYQQVNVFVRGALSEFAALHLLVVSLCLLLNYVREKRCIYLAGASLFITLMICSHAVTALIATPLLLIFALAFQWHDQRRLNVRSIMPVFIGLGLSAFYWLPALGETRFVQTEAMLGGSYSWQLHFLYWPQWLNVTYWGFGPSMPGPDDGMPLHVGFAQLVFFILAWWVYLKRRLECRATAWPLFAGSLMVLIFLFFTINVSVFFWRHLPLMRYVQFPWRFLGEVGVFMALAGGAGVELLLKNKERRAYAVCSLVLLIVIAPPWHWNPTQECKPLLSARPSADELRAQTWALTGVDEYLPRGVQLKFPKEYLPRSIRIVKGSGTGTPQDVVARTPVTVIYGEYWFPGIEVASGRKIIASRASTPHGLVEFDLPAGNHSLSIEHTRTPMQRIGDCLAILSIVGLILYGCITYIRSRRLRAFDRA